MAPGRSIRFGLGAPGSGMKLLIAIVFISSFLLFQIELIVSKAMLPGFGGTYLIFSVNMAFFQGVLLAGYLYVKTMDRRLGSRAMFPIHLVLFFVSLAVLPLEVVRFSRPEPSSATVLPILALLAATIGPLFFMLSTTSVFTQKVLAESDLPESANPYPLYAVSNLGAFAALFTYPFLVEPLSDLRTQLIAWQAGYLVLTALHLPLWRIAARGPKRPSPTADGGGATRDTPGRIVQWFLYAAAGSSMFLAATNLITLNLPPLPFFWVLPLGVYLLTLALSYKKKHFYPAIVEKAAFLPAAAALVLFLFITQRGVFLDLTLLLAAHLIILFFVCLVAHGELARARPDDRTDLTGYYLVIAAGGFAGGAVVSWVAPLVFKTTSEYLIGPMALFIALALQTPRAPAGSLGKLSWVAAPLVTLASAAAIAYFYPRQGLGLPVLAAALAIPVVFFLARKMRTALAASLALTLVVASSGPWQKTLFNNGTLEFIQRNYYTIYKIYDRDNIRYLEHGVTIHGAQSLRPEFRRVPLGYFHPSTPIGEIMTDEDFKLGRVGIIGLGAGSLAAYARPGQVYDFYELDPDNGVVAQKYFSYLSDSAARVSLIFGDGRLSLSRRAEAAPYDIFIIDAFNSDSIPVHLITVEALEEYRERCVPGGLIVFHITNGYLDLWNPLEAEAREVGLTAMIKTNAGSVHPEASTCIWAVLTDDPRKTRRLLEMGFTRLTGHPNTRPVKPWRDDYVNIFSALEPSAPLASLFQD